MRQLHTGTIRNKKELEDAILLVRFMKQMEQGPEMEKWISEQKRRIREFQHRQSDRIVVQSHGIDGYTLRICIPAGIETKEDAEEWFDAEERIDYTERGYDCTGQAFTGWHYIAPLAGRLVCWHRVNFDV